MVRGRKVAPVLQQLGIRDREVQCCSSCGETSNEEFLNE